MRISELDIPASVLDILTEKGLDKLYPPQEAAIKTGVLDGVNLVLASPTASGKTLIAELCALKHVLERNGKVLYLAPLRALAWEKYEEFQKYEDILKPNGLKIKVGVSSGDLDNKSTFIQNYDILVTTNEKCDSLLRHRSLWMNGVTLVIADEVHLIGNDRGPTLEVAIARLKQINEKIQVLALSATIRNVDEIAEWLDAQYIDMNWRPTPLREGVALKNKIIFNDGTNKNLENLSKNDAINIAINGITSGGQSIIFVESRRRAQSIARESSSILINHLSKREQTELAKLSSEINMYGEKTKITDDLSNAIAKGAAFHHAGLNRDHRRIIEQAFKNGIIKILSATPTLAAGVNLPARTAVIGSYRRWTAGYGLYPISVLEYKQMSGRAGRPQFDDYGEAVLIAQSNDEQDSLFENYITAKPEKLYSRLAQEAAIRGHTLASIASDYVHTEDGLIEFFSKTFYGYHYPMGNIKLILTGILSYLRRQDMITYKGDFIYATDFGRRVSELYLDPLSAEVIRNGLKYPTNEVTDFTWLHLICHTNDMRPIIRPRANDKDDVEDYYQLHHNEIACSKPDSYDYIDYEQFLGEVKTAMVLNSWIKESSESDLLEKYNVAPGDRYTAVTNADWLLYSIQELAETLGITDYRRHLRRIRDRVRYGVNNDLLPLVRIQGIGRIRARVLFKSGYKTLEDLKRAPLAKLVEIPLIGPRLAKAIKEQVGGLVDQKEWKNLDNILSEQRSLTDFIEEDEKDFKDE